MKYQSTISLFAILGLTVAVPMPAPRNKFSVPGELIETREVPQEHSHERFITTVRTNLALNNPDNIQDPIFGLLGNAAAKVGAGSITNLDCLHQATADQAFTNAKAANDVSGMSDALIFAALERNTAGVGTASVICNETAVNPEVAAIQQHQDPASAGAAAHNKGVVLALAKELAAIGANPQYALLSGTFAPGSTSDNTGKGLTCDTADDTTGCIFTQNLLVEDATAAEISAAVAGVAVSSGTLASATASLAPALTTAASAESASVCAAIITSTITVDAVPAAVTKALDTSLTACAAPVTVTVSNGAKETAAAAATSAPLASATSASPSSATSTAAPLASGTNVQTFTGTLGGAPPAVTEGSGDRPFTVNGNTFVNQGAALQRSCAIQNNACANAVNSGTLSGTTVSDCGAQEEECNAAAPAK